MASALHYIVLWAAMFISFVTCSKLDGSRFGDEDRRTGRWDDHRRSPVSDHGGWNFNSFRTRTCDKMTTYHGICSRTWAESDESTQMAEALALDQRRKTHRLSFNSKLGQPMRSIHPNLTIQFAMDAAANQEWASVFFNNSAFASGLSRKYFQQDLGTLGISNFTEYADILEYYQEAYVKTPPLASKYRPWRPHPASDQRITQNDRWNDDVIFDASRLAGFNPVNIYRIGSYSLKWRKFASLVADNFNWFEAVRRASGNRILFWQALFQGRLFVQYHPILRSLINDPDGPGAFKGQRYLSPLVLFVLPPRQFLMRVVAIQLGERAAAKVYSPGTSSFFWWTYAKAIANNANVVQSSLVRHLHDAHFVSERLQVATERELSPQHPVRRFLSYHYNGLHQTNSLSLLRLINPGGSVHSLLEPGHKGATQILREAFKLWNYVNMHPEEDARYRGVNNLPYYPYLEDSKDFFNVLRKFADGFVRLHYCCDSQVRADTALQHWVRYSAMTALRGEKGLPMRLSSIPDLVDYITRQLWLLTGYHAAVNYPNGDILYTPFNPFAIFLRPDQVNETLAAQTSPANLEYLKRAIGGLQHTLGSYSLGFTLAGFQFRPVLDTRSTMPYHLTPLIRAAKRWLAVLEQKISSRNSLRRHHGVLPYRYLLPSEVSGSIAI